MGNAFSKFGLSDAELQKQISESVEVDAGLDKFMAEEVVPYWKSVSPVRSGKYAASVKVVKKARGGKGKVAATDFKAHWIEFGTGEPGKTKAFAPGQKTAEHVGGTLSEGIDVGDDE